MILKKILLYLLVIILSIISLTIVAIMPISPIIQGALFVVIGCFAGSIMNNIKLIKAGYDRQ